MQTVEISLNTMEKAKSFNNEIAKLTMILT